MIIRYLFISLCLLICSSCISNKNSYAELNGITQGTTYHIVYLDQAYNNYSIDVENILMSIDTLFSTYLPISLVSRINNNITHSTTNVEFINLVNLSNEINKKTNGAFDITVGPLVRLWGFGPDSVPVADTSKIKDLLKNIGMQYLQVSDSQLIKLNGSTILDFNAIAQGYAVDKISLFLESKKVKNYLVEIGGEVRTKGVNRNGISWRIGIDKPIEGNMHAGENLQAILSISGKSIATSGNYRKYYKKEGNTYAHTINPKSGFPAENDMLSATIIADDCARADGYATACMVLGFENSKKILKSNNLEGFFVYTKNGKPDVYKSEGFTYLVKDDK